MPFFDCIRKVYHAQDQMGTIEPGKQADIIV